MSKVVKSCLYCSADFEADTREINRGNAKFCSRSCFGAYRTSTTPPKPVNAYCAYCGVGFNLSPSKQAGSKSGFVFCCRGHKDLAQRIGGLEAIQPSHYGSSLQDYRSIASRSLAKVCAECGYDKIPAILEVHHRDHNRKNNHVDNLQYLCPNCHQEHHYNTRSGRFLGTRGGIRTRTPEGTAF